MRGTEIPNHSAKMATRVPKGIAAEEPSTQRIRFIRKKSAKTILGDKVWVKDGDTEREETFEMGESSTLGKIKACTLQREMRQMR